MKQKILKHKNQIKETTIIKKILLFLAYNIIGIIIGFIVSLAIAFILLMTRKIVGFEGTVYGIFIIILGTGLGHSIGISIFLYIIIPIKNIFLKILLIISLWFTIIYIFFTNLNYFT